jgi:hypothetical protein
LIEDGSGAKRRFTISREADPFGDIDQPPFDAVPCLTESGDLPILFADLPASKAPRFSRRSFLATEVTASATYIVARSTT